MKQLICEMCNSNELLKVDGVFVCQSCGTKYSVEEAKKMMIDGTVDVQGTVKVDSSDELNNLYEIARRAKADKNYENALKYYDMILVKDPNSWEANFYTTYYQVMNCKIGEIRTAATKLVNSERTFFGLIKNSVDSLEYSSILNEVCADLIDIARLLYQSYHNHYNDIGESIRANYMGEYLAVADTTRNILYIAGDLIVEYFGDDYGAIAAACWQGAVMMHNKVQQYAYNWKRNFNIGYNMEQNANRMRSYNDKIAQYNADYIPEPVYMGLSTEQLEVEKRNKALGGFFAVLIVLVVIGVIIGIGVGLS